MLKIVTAMSQLNSEQLMGIYLAENQKDGKLRYPDSSVEEQRKRAENAYLSYLREDFFQQRGARYCIWVIENEYKSALRLEPHKDGLLLEGLGTASGDRRKGYAFCLLSEVLRYLRSTDCKAVYSHVDKRNKPSLGVHLKCGFRRISECAALVDGTVTNRSCTMCYDFN